MYYWEFGGVCPNCGYCPTCGRSHRRYHPIVKPLAYDWTPVRKPHRVLGRLSFVR